MIDHLSDERLHQLVTDDIVCVQDWVRSMAAELLAARARVTELESGRDIADDFGLQSLAVENGAAILTTAPTTDQARALVLAMSEACGKMLDDDQASNYIEFEVHKAQHPGYVVHVRRAERPSPHTLRREAEARADKAEARAAELEAAKPIGYAVVSTAGQDDYLDLASDLLHQQADSAHGELIMALAGSPSVPWRVVELREAR
ncbi:hypothetical protein AB0J48_20630 [Nocardia salmonicida]|uniref:hypothetical protein n=1 Tax=Nocardia salmonicida TaxID=53431 RepID=UPI00342AF383